MSRTGGTTSGELRREAAKSLRARLQARAEQDEALLEKLYAAYAGALEAEQVAGEYGMLPDHRARFQAADAFMAQLYGKPIQPVDSAGPQVVVVMPNIRGDDPADVAVVSRPSHKDATRTLPPAA